MLQSNIVIILEQKVRRISDEIIVVKGLKGWA